jgi:DNA-binding response OmpR family regulator
MKLLLMKDECKLVEAMSHLLKKNGYAVDTAMDEETGLEMATTGLYDIIILDRVLPGRTGITFLKKLRNLKINTPILFLTPKDTPKYRVEALDAGADDSLAKPFFTGELLARLRALTRRRDKDFIGDSISAAGLTLNPLKGKVIKGNELINLTMKESLLLEMLMRNFGQVITKERIMEKVWSYNSETNIANIDLYIHYLRKKLNSSNIKTVRGVGYFLQEDTCV